jgi:hypothetical protein
MPPFDPGPVTEPFAGLARTCRRAGPRTARVDRAPDSGRRGGPARAGLSPQARDRPQLCNGQLLPVLGVWAGGRRTHADDPEIAAYRHRWLDALFDASQIEAVISFGHLGRHAFERWRHTPRGQAVNPHFEPLVHPTMPEAASKGDENKRRELTRDMLQNWNRALERLHSAITAPDVHDLRSRDRARIPSDDLPAGAPVWWSSVEQWAARRAVGSFDDRTAEVEAKRATIVVTVPNGERPWHEH